MSVEPMRRYRDSIVGLMGVVLVSAVGIAALRHSTVAWVGAIDLLTRAILGLAVVKAIYVRGPARAGWLGFAVFGWGFLGLVMPRMQEDDSPLPYLPTRILLAAEPLLGRHPGFDRRDFVFERFFTGDFRDVLYDDYIYLRIGYDLMSMVVALVGGMLARLAFARSPGETGPGPTLSPACAGWVRATFAAWAALVPITATIALRSTWRAGFWAGLTFLLTSGLLGLAGLAAIHLRGRRRGPCVGAAMFGGGYLVLVFTPSPYLPMPTGLLLQSLRSRFPALAGPTAASNARIIEELERPIPMEFPRKTPLSAVLAYLKKSTSPPNGPGIPIYLDPVGLAEAERTPDSTIAIELRGVPLKVSLAIALGQVGMGYIVEDGMLRITSAESMHDQEAPFYSIGPRSRDHRSFGQREARLALTSDLADPYLIVGHCLLAMLLAGLGAIASPRIAGAVAHRPNA